MATRLRLAMMTWIILSSIPTLALVNASSPAEPIKLTIQVDNRVNYIAWIKAVVERFEEEHPNIKVDVVAPTGNLGEAIIVNLASGMPLDIGIHDPYFLIDLARKGLLEDLTPYIERDIDHFKDWYEPALQMNQFQGRIYALPRDLQIYGVYYNVDAFNESGVEFPDRDWTWADFHDKARRLIVVDQDNNVIRRGSVLPKWRNWVIPVWAHGGDFVDSWTDPTQFIRSEGLVEGIQFLKDFVTAQGLTRSTDASWGESAAFYDQRNAIFMQNTIAIQSLRDIHDFTWDVAPMPVGPAGRITVLNALNWFIASSSPHKNEAWTLLRYITSPPSLSLLVEMVGVPPPHREVVVNEWMRSLDRPESRLNILVDIDFARPTIGALPASVYNPLVDESNKVIWGEESFSAAIENMEKRVNAAIAELLAQ